MLLTRIIQEADHVLAPTCSQSRKDVTVFVAAINEEYLTMEETASLASMDPFSVAHHTIDWDSDSTTDDSTSTEPSAGRDVPAPRRVAVAPSLETLASGTWRALLSQAHLVGLPTSRGIWARAAEAIPEPTSSRQCHHLETLALLSTLLHRLALRFPRNQNHNLATLQRLRDSFVSKGWSEDCFEDHIQYCKDQLKANKQPELVYKSYVMDGGRCNNYENKIYGGTRANKRGLWDTIGRVTSGAGGAGGAAGAGNARGAAGAGRAGGAADAEEPGGATSARTAGGAAGTGKAGGAAGSASGRDRKSSACGSGSSGSGRDARSGAGGREQSNGDTSLKSDVRANINGYDINEKPRVPPSILPIFCAPDLAADQQRLLEPSSHPYLTSEQLEKLEAYVPTSASGHVTLLEAIDGISRGTTGLTSWGGGAVMAEWLQNNKQLLRDKRVLELGAGIGYMAASVVMSCGGAPTCTSYSSTHASTPCRSLPTSPYCMTPPTSPLCRSPPNSPLCLSPPYSPISHSPPTSPLCMSPKANKKQSSKDSRNTVNTSRASSHASSDHGSSSSSGGTPTGANGDSSSSCSATAGVATSLSSLGGLVSYTATDCHPHVLDLLYHNLTLLDKDKSWSYSQLCSHQLAVCERLASEELQAGDQLAQPWSPQQHHLSIRGVATQVLYLDWRTPNYAVIPYSDVIVAADIVYCRHLMTPLARLLRGLLSRRPDSARTFSSSSDRSSRSSSQCNDGRSGRDSSTSSAASDSSQDTTETSSEEDDETDSCVPVAYIACTRRVNETIAQFLATLTEENLSYSLVYQATLATESALFVFNESHIPVRIYKIGLANSEAGT